MKIYNKRTEIPEQYKWDLEALLKNKTAVFYFNKIKKSGEYLIKSNETFVNSLDDFKKYIKELETLHLNGSIYGNWISNNSNINVVDDEFRQLFEEFRNWYQKFSQENANINNFIIKNKSKILQYLKDPKLQDYDFYFWKIFDEKKHLLSKKEEILFSAFQRAISDSNDQFSILHDSEVVFEPVLDSKGKLHKLTSGNYLTLSKSKDAVIRENTFKNYHDGFLKHKESFATLLYNHKKTESTIAKIRKYDSSVQMLTSSDYIDEKILTNIYEIVSEKSYLFYKFKKLWKRNFEKVHGYKPKEWDSNVELIKFNQKYTVESAQKMVLEAIEPFGKEYTTVVQSAFDDRWVDYMPVTNKRTGAYSIGETYNTKRKYILMNFDGTFRAVETLAHELGHSMHSYFSDKNNSLVNSQYEILVAEIASTFNELMLADHILKNSKSVKQKLFVTEQLITGAIGAIHRQALWSEYEFELYKAIDQGLPVTTYKSQLEIYERIFQKYIGHKGKEKLTKRDMASSFYVPHFYYGFYVFKYVIGLTGAYSFYNKYQNEGKPALDNYIKNFLSAGGRGKPVERLQKAGLDLTNPQFLYDAFSTLEGYIKEYEKLSKEVFK